MNTFHVVLVKNSLKIFFFILCFFNIQSCSDSQISKKLADSFETPLGLDISTKPSKKATLDSSPKAKKPSKIPEKKTEVVLDSSSLKNTSSYNTRKNILPKNNNQYRIIIKIYQATPTAPAAKVTSALINAGVVFEVEKIERYEVDSLQQNFSSR